MNVPENIVKRVSSPSSPVTDCSSFANALRSLWNSSGLRQEEFAERLGYRRPTVANMLRLQSAAAGVLGRRRGGLSSLA
jgi:hypothetical protein